MRRESVCLKKALVVLIQILTELLGSMKHKQADDTVVYRFGEVCTMKSGTRPLTFSQCCQPA